ncbi:DUF4259 domain-containing protein [Streptomyces sp. NPDC001340]
MGTWDTGPFDNDTAADWCNGLDDAALNERAGMVRGPEEPLPDLTSLRPLALQALDRVVTEPSELLALWEESEGYPWRSGVERIRHILLPPSEGEQLSLC